MSKRFLQLGLVLGFCLALLPSLQADVDQIYQDGQRAFERGDYQTARMLFEVVLDRQPSHQMARNYVRRIMQREAALGSARDMERKLSGVMIDSINLENASLSSVTDYLRQKVVESTGGGVSVNFVLNLPPEEADGRRVTLSLENIPLLEALRYITELAGVRYQIEAHAVVIRPLGGTVQPATAPPAGRNPAMKGRNP